MRFVALVALAGCSFVGIRAPSSRIDPLTTRADAIKCNESTLLPSIDALGGAAAISVAGGGVLLEQTTDKSRYDHFTLYYAGPLLALAITYWYSAAFGNARVTRCTELKEKARLIQPAVRPIEFDGKQQETDPEPIEIR
jgi:hypothetical protein